ncbi:LADA_0D05138g1_1 [Lachancea dasiensis]|uniref:Exonuclease V, mitochondrial n=1 Tax=Lachancea dasiensis TaxID=1072105 RepID=A0A1G4J5B2_9SACH|nr:LADA_0D05138g1_1 [Lachancea dasiensis]
MTRPGPLTNIRRYVHLPRTARSPRIDISDHSLAPTPEELEAINNLPFFQEEKKVSNRPITKAKQSYLENKLRIVRQLFKHECNAEYLSYTLPMSMQNPYLDAHARATADPETGAIQYAGTPRLSVTKMLTKRWCELRETYDIYSQIPIYEHSQVAQGRQVHQMLEEEAHVPIDVEEFKTNFEVTIPNDAFHTLVEDWYATTTRLLTLLKTGEAREILCHGYLNPESCRLLKGNVTSDEDILVSGIIDHLVLRRRDSSTSAPRPLVSDWDDQYGADALDIRKILERLSVSVKDAKEDMELIISDVKTRPTKTVPTQQTVITAAKLQVMYYRYFMETLGLDAHATYNKLLINAQRRGHDVDQPVEPGKIIYLMEVDPIMKADMVRLHNGSPIGFEPFDKFYSQYKKTEACTWESLTSRITDPLTRQKYGSLFSNWATPVTLRYFAARLAQLYHILGPLLSSELMIEYYSGNKNFHNISFTYDSQALMHQSTDSALFWFGKRNIEPIKPTLRNVLTYCKYCDYQSICLWKKEAKEKAQNLGKDLEKLYPGVRS